MPVTQQRTLQEAIRRCRNADRQRGTEHLSRQAMEQLRACGQPEAVIQVDAIGYRPHVSHRPRLHPGKRRMLVEHHRLHEQHRQQDRTDRESNGVADRAVIAEVNAQQHERYDP